ncbi:hypothetical protein Gogos_014309, partial [Gossypium gossypioides]|nr:hypothetical protein [Gossypium gossypioides]
MVLQLCNTSRAIGAWEQELAWAVSKFKGKFLVLKLAWSAYIHSIWGERNGRYFGKPHSAEGAILMKVKQIVQTRLM